MRIQRKELFRNKMPALGQVMLLLMMALLPLALTAQNVKMTRAEYVEMYKEIAVREMIDFSIPASITLAQGIIESGSGNSRLAREGNNHFGIKCHVGWEGKSMLLDDDAANECFRVYANAEESYKDHSFFLSQRSRYAFLFELPITDYKGWAHGLKKAGYATNPKYAGMLIKIIEELELYKYDLLDKDALARQKRPDEIPSADQRKYEAFGVGKNNRKVLTNNERKFIFARKGDDFYKIAADFNIYNYQVWKYNDLTKNDKIKEGDMVYLQRKKSKATTPYHYVKQGETMRTISQLYGIRLNKLYRKNRMEPGTEPRTGQMLWLQDKKPRK
ncbi:MAG: glucosaminidase domain-containing protein [Bacteroidales bacterium]|nr:glucosaminidase domain-containing protein [Bacteroidales bacterium]MDD4175655.1 glucosaminidase domain-containing protein [Bacteroidales bacterium]MDY0333947.1 glucosaminidase domain-containing protein [Bacteroidales bacterium]